jgi:FkbM family methyltransferase
VADSIAYVSRKLAQSRCRKVSVALFRYFPAKKGLATIHDFDGDLSMILDRASYISSAIYWGGHHSLDIYRFVQDYLKSDMVFADIGANIGEITLAAAKRLPRGKVLAFEPSPVLFAQLQRNVALNRFGDVTLFNFGLFDRSESVPLYLRIDTPYGTDNDGISSLFSYGTTRQEFTVPLRRFDDVADECGLTRLDLMKIDVEGAELMVLRGAERSLRQYRPVIVAEIDEPYFQIARYSTKELLAYLHSLDYEVPSTESSLKELPAKCDAICFPRELGRPMEILAPG